MKAHHQRRLLKLADLLDTVPVHKFDLGLWHNGEKNCQTVGCAVGWAAAIPAFRRAGLKLTLPDYVPAYVPAFGGLTGFDAAAEFFGLTFSEAQRLFSPEAYPSGHTTRPTTVAKRIRRQVESGKS